MVNSSYLIKTILIVLPVIINYFQVYIFFYIKLVEGIMFYLHVSESMK